MKFHQKNLHMLPRRIEEKNTSSCAVFYEVKFHMTTSLQLIYSMICHIVQTTVSSYTTRQTLLSILMVIKHFHFSLCLPDICYCDFRAAWVIAKQPFHLSKHSVKDFINQGSQKTSITVKNRSNLSIPSIQKPLKHQVPFFHQQKQLLVSENPPLVILL